MKYNLIIFIFLLAQNVSTAQLGWTYQGDSTVTKTGLRYDITQRPWAVHFDLSRLNYKTPSIQLSTSYRLNYRIGFESEINYYLDSKVKNESTRLDALQINLSTTKPSWFISGISKLYYRETKIQYIGLRIVGGFTNFDLSRKVCIEAEPATSGQICRCLQTENRELAVHKAQFLFGLRYGFDFPVTKHIRFNMFMDFGKYHYSKPSYQYLEHACGRAWQYFDKVPRTDGLFADYQEEPTNLYFSLGAKLGYAF